VRGPERVVTSGPSGVQKKGCVIEGGVGVDGVFAGGEHVKVRVL
jgi:hypothetical protein